MNVELSSAQVKLLDTILGLDLGAIGLAAGQQKMAHTIRMKLLAGPHGIKGGEGIVGSGRLADADALGDRTAPIARQYEPLRVLKLTPSYRHSDK